MEGVYERERENEQERERGVEEVLPKIPECSNVLSFSSFSVKSAPLSASNLKIST